MRDASTGDLLSESPTVLLVEDEYLLQADLEKVLVDAGFATAIVASGDVTSVARSSAAG